MDELASKLSGPTRTAKAAQEKPVRAEDLMRPVVTITKVEKDAKNGRKWTITAVAEPADKKQPIETLKLFVDGRPLPGGISVRALKTGERTVTWVVPEMPPGKVELKVLARAANVFGISEPKKIDVPVPAALRPKLHIVSVGLTYTGDKALSLGAVPKNDAEAIEKAFPAACVGPNNLFVRAYPKLLLDKSATAPKVLSALEDVLKVVKPRDLVVFFYAGHGVNERSEFYLLTHGADLRDLAKTALSGGKLRERLAEFPCQVLVLLEACHSGQSAKALRAEKKGEEASQQLADEDCSATLIAASMGHERALAPAGGKHGYFTQGLLKALEGTTNDVTHDRSTGMQFVHHLFGDVFDYVRRQTGDRQHPTLSLPWTIESYPIRRVAQPRVP
jgi:hypothetical protein